MSIAKEEEPHVLIISYPSQGHINPLIQLAKFLAQCSLRITFITTDAAINSIVKSKPASLARIEFQSFTVNAGLMNSDGSTVAAYLQRFRSDATEFLTATFSRLSPVCVVYDSFMPWVLEIAKPMGILSAPFFTQSCAVGAIYYLYYRGLFSAGQPPAAELLGLEELTIRDVPSFMLTSNPYPVLTSVVLEQFSNLSEATWVLGNSFDELETRIIQSFRPKLPVKTIGPMLPSAYFSAGCSGGLDRRFDGDMFEAAFECIKWLDGKEDGSVVYVSFGSLLALSDEQMEELAFGLKQSGKAFLWVVKKPEDGSVRQGNNKLPEWFVEETREQGLVVPWCSQLEVLSHPAIGCFVSHCGWNSTLESLTLGVPVVAMPQWTDQPTNGKFIADVWQVGVRAAAGEKGVVGREELVSCLGLVMDVGEKRREVRANAARWSELARAAVKEGGSSSRNLQDFVDGIRRSHASKPAVCS
ncbi:UDP-glycosyltransferase [Nymphaea thermarum]|nr:UDP-glycosyltransferase [Nymphaea thermarum]